MVRIWSPAPVDLHAPEFAALLAPFTSSRSGFSSRNYYAPQVAFALQKQFSIRESMKLQLRAEAFNAFNTPIFGGPSTSNPNQAVKPVFFTNRNGVQTQILSGPGSCTGYGCISATERDRAELVQRCLDLVVSHGQQRCTKSFATA